MQKEQKKELEHRLENLKGTEANLSLRLQNEQVPSIFGGEVGEMVPKELSTELCCIV